MRKTILALTIASALPLAAQQAPQLTLPRVSQKQSVTQTVGLTDVTITYSRPGVKGRPIWGALVPYDKVWRTGANEATTFVTDTNVSIGGKAIPAGSYTLFTVPNADKWTLIVNKKTAEWGIPYKYEADELGRVNMVASKLRSPVENFTIVYEQSPNGCTLNMDWENTRASVNIGEAK